MPTPTVLYRSRSTANFQPAHKPRFAFPLPPECPIQLAAYAFDQDAEMDLGSFPPAPKNTLSTAAAFSLSDANAILTGYSQPQTTGAGMGRFSARFNIVPASWDDFQELTFAYPGWIGAIGTSTARDPRTYKVPCRFRFDYFLVDPTEIAAGARDSSGAAINVVASLSAIAPIFKTPWLETSLGLIVPGGIAQSLVAAAGYLGYQPTIPTTETYKGWLANVAAHGWSLAAGATLDQTSSGVIWNGIDNSQAKVTQVIADDSIIVAYAGNIVARVSYFALLK